MTRSTFSLAAVISAAIALAPQLAIACAVCFTGRTEETRIAFLATTGFMTAFPILLIGSVVWWLRRRAQQLRDEHEAPKIVDAPH